MATRVFHLRSLGFGMLGTFMAIGGIAGNWALIGPGAVIVVCAGAVLIASLNPYRNPGKAAASATERSGGSVA